MKGLYWSAVLNGLLAPFFLAGVWVVIRNNKIMQGSVCSLASIWAVGITTILMFIAGAAMLTMGSP